MPTIILIKPEPIGKRFSSNQNYSRIVLIEPNQTKTLTTMIKDSLTFPQWETLKSHLTLKEQKWQEQTVVTALKEKYLKWIQLFAGAISSQKMKILMDIQITQIWISRIKRRNKLRIILPTLLICLLKWTRLDKSQVRALLLLKQPHRSE